EAMAKIKKELGPDAVILNSKQIKTGGIFGLFKKKKIEVIAALDEVKHTTTNRATNKTAMERKLTNVVTKQKDDNDETLLQEIRELRKMLITNSLQSKNDYPPAFEHIFSYLVKHDVTEEIAKQIVEEMIERNEKGETDDVSLKDLLKTTIADLLHVDSGISFDNKVIQFVGPTGVGKTTTLAKVAALSVLQHKKKIAFITTDTYRIAAIDQLKTYAKILDVPVK